MNERIGRQLTGCVLTLTLMLVSAVTLAAEVEGEVEAEEVRYSRYLSQVSENVVLAGELDLQTLQASHDGGIRIIDLRTPAEGSSEEAIDADVLGMEYANIPVSSAVVDPAHVAALRAELASAAPDELVVVHCRTGNRAGLLWGAAQLEAGVPLEQVQAEVSGVVTAPPIAEGLEAYAKTLDAGL